MDSIVTVVVPIYKTERYLERCLNSIVNQTYKNLDILLVDDGSPDKCPQICDEWEQRDRRIRVIHKENQGLGMARNTGIDNALGEYICFFDSDDYIALDTIEKAVSCAKEYNAELVTFGFSAVNSAGDVIDTFTPDASKRQYEAEAVCNIFLPDLIAPDPNVGVRRFYMSACMMLYTTKLLVESNWRFASEREIISEDVYFLLGLCRYVRCVAVVPHALYFYCENEVSLSRGYKPDRYEKIRFFYKRCIELSDEFAYSIVVKSRLSDPFLAFTRAAMKQEVAADIPLTVKMRNLKTIVNDDVLQNVVQTNKKDVANIARMILFFAMKYRLYWLCYILCSLQNHKK